MSTTSGEATGPMTADRSTGSTPTADEHMAMLTVVRDIAAKDLSPRSALLDAYDRHALADCARRLAEVGLDRAVLPEDHGGVGLTASDFLAIVEELAIGDAGMALSMLLSNAALAALEPEWAACLSPRCVLVPARLDQEVRLSGGRLSGRIESALGAYAADTLVLITSGPDPVALSVAVDAKGMTVERDETQMGLRAAPAASLTFDNVPVEVATPAREAASVLLWAGTAAVARGIARRAYEMAFAYAHMREQGGRSIIDYDAVGDMLAAMAVRISGPLPPVGGMAEVLAVKIATTDAAVATTLDAVQVFGGTGYMYDTGVEKLMRDAKYCQLFPETNWVAQDELLRLERARRGRHPAHSPST